jgi:hypothetical protein
VQVRCNFLTPDGGATKAQPALWLVHRHLLPFAAAQVRLDILGQWPRLLECSLKPCAAYAEARGPIPDFIVIIDIDAGGLVRPAPFTIGYHGSSSCAREQFSDEDASSNSVPFPFRNMA